MIDNADDLRDKANEFNATKVKVKCEEKSIALRDPSLSKEESLKQLISRAKENGENIVEYLKSFIVIEEVAL